MKTYHHYIQQFKKYLHPDLGKLELSVWLHSVGRNLVSVFIPIIMLVSGFSLTQVLIFFFLFCLIDAPLNLLARKLVIRIGAKNTIIIGILAEAAYFILLSLSYFTWPILIGLAITAALYDSFYWTAHWFVFNECVETKKGVGKQIGFLEITREVGAILSPLIGALFLIFSRKEYLIILSLILLALSIWPLTKIRLDYLNPKTSQSPRQFFKDKENRKNIFLISLYAIHSEIDGTIFPVFIYITFKSFGFVGVLPIIAAITSVIFMYYISRLVDKVHKLKIIIVGASLIGLMWLLRIHAPNLTILYATAIIVGFCAIMIGFSLDARIIEAGKRTDMLDASTFRNAVHMGIRAVLYAVLLLVLAVIHIAFVIAAIAMFSLIILAALLHYAKSEQIG